MKAGYYDVVLGDRIQERLAFNYDRRESDLSLYADSELGDMVKNDAVNILGFEEQEGIRDFVGEKTEALYCGNGLSWQHSYFCWRKFSSSGM